MYIDSLIPIKQVQVIGVRLKVRLFLKGYIIPFEIVENCLLIIRLRSYERFVFINVLVISELVIRCMKFWYNRFIVREQPVIKNVLHFLIKHSSMSVLMVKIFFVVGI